MASIAEAVKAAQESAAAVVQNETAQAPAVIDAYASAGGTVVPFTKPRMGELAGATSLIPRSSPYLKVNEFGLYIGSSKEFFDSTEVEILMIEGKGFKVKNTLRFGNPAVYLSTYDGRVCDKGGSWHDAMTRARMVNPSVEPYNAADIPLTLLKDIELKKTPKVAAGTLLGFTTSMSNFSNWVDFYNMCEEMGLLGQPVKAKLGAQEIQSKGNTWGVVTFELLA